MRILCQEIRKSFYIRILVEKNHKQIPKPLNMTQRRIKIKSFLKHLMFLLVKKNTNYLL